jgi:hypothetical protein
MSSYKTDIVLGDRYVDEQTGYDGVASAVTFYQHACERVVLESYDASRREVKEVVFDAPRLTSIETRETATSARPGGDRPDTSRPADGRR